MLAAAYQVPLPDRSLLICDNLPFCHSARQTRPPGKWQEGTDLFGVPGNQAGRAMGSLPSLRLTPRDLILRDGQSMGVGWMSPCLGSGKSRGEGGHQCVLGPWWPPQPCTPCPSLLVSRCWVMLLLLGGVWRLTFVVRVKAKARARSSA